MPRIFADRMAEADVTPEAMARVGGPQPAFRLGRARPVAALLLALLVQGCAMAPRELFSATDQGSAVVPGYTGIRAWADAPPELLARRLGSPRFKVTPSHDVNYLALSGGGSAGSFSAGVLKGWTATGQRPEFDIVSGVSTGALIAPFAFLGSPYDDLLASLYTGEVAADLAKAQNPIKIVSSGGINDPGPLRRLVERYATADMLSQIAEQHRRGRRLLVITTNLDAQRPVLWDMGAIAASGRPDALALFRDVLVASSSVPAAYPPVMIDVDLDGGGRRVHEMHVDGGTTTQVYMMPDILRPPLARLRSRDAKRIHLWVIVNNTLPPEFSITDTGAVPIAVRSLSTLMKSQTKGIVTAASEAAARLGMDFNVAYIDRTIPYTPSKPFDPAYMDAVFTLGMQEAQDGTLWHKSMGSWMETAR